MVQRITVQQAQELIARGEVEVVDVRDVPEWSSGHLPAARHVSLGRLRSNPKAFLSHDNVLFVCAAGNRSHMAGQLALAAGLTTVYSLEGGTRAWSKAGLPLVRPVQQATG